MTIGSSCTEKWSKVQEKKISKECNTNKKINTTSVKTIECTLVTLPMTNNKELLKLYFLNIIIIIIIVGN